MAAIKDLTVEELERLIEDVIRRTLEDYREDLEALASPSYLSSIEEARQQYRAGQVERLGDVEDG